MDDTRRAVVLALAATIILSIAFSSVFVYYPIEATIQPVQPPVKLDYGKNANGNDLGSTDSQSNKIEVRIGLSNANATITIHPTYEASYYENVTIIRNTDIKSYTVTLKVYEAVSGLPSGSKALLYLFTNGTSRSLSGWPSKNLEPASGSYRAVLDLTQTNKTATVTLNGGSIVEVDILVYIPEGNSLPSPATAKIYLVYTPG
jgi:hypothetical protein